VGTPARIGPSRPGSSPITNEPPRPLALVVEDAPDTRAVLSALAKKRGFDVIEAADGVEGVEAARTHRPELILMDIRMPKMDGLTALAEIREENPAVSVVIVSSSADREYLEQALELGAVNFVHKPFDHAELSYVLDRVYRAVEEEADIRQVVDVVAVRSTRLSIPGVPSAIAKIVAYLGRELRNNYPGWELPYAEIKLALYEALANAVEHGNLGITYEAKTKALQTPGGIDEMIRKRLADPEYMGRRVHVEADYLPGSVAYRIRDEGHGFDPEMLSRTPLADTSALHGRGIALIRHYMSDVTWNETGNEIRLLRRLPPAPGASLADGAAR
jgi:CheY-like chemotaxis protein